MKYIYIDGRVSFGEDSKISVFEKKEEYLNHIEKIDDGYEWGSTKIETDCRILIYSEEEYDYWLFNTKSEAETYLNKNPLCKEERIIDTETGKIIEYDLIYVLKL